MLIAVAVIAVPILAVAGFLVLVPPPVDGLTPESWRPDPPAPIDASITTPIESVQPVVTATSLDGPEDIAVDNDGALYTGGRGDTLWRIPPGGEPEPFAHVGGRPLGLAFAPDGRLLIANHGIGLQAVTPDGTVQTLLDEVDGTPMLFANDLDISGRRDRVPQRLQRPLQHHHPRRPQHLVPPPRPARRAPSGRVIAYDSATGTVTAILDDLHVPNGIALTADQTRLWIAESNRYRILEHHLGADSTTGTTVVLDNLPGTPDNIDRDPDGRMLIALYDRTGALDTFVLPHDLARHVMIRLPASLFVNEDDPLTGSILVADDTGTPIGHHTGLDPAPASIFAHDQDWYLGALLGQTIRRTPTP